MQYALISLFTVMLYTSAFGEVPKNANKYLPILKQEAAKFNSPIPVSVLAGLVHSESCVTARSRTCWKPTAQFKTSREQGVGFGMITRAYNSNGRLRFDSMRTVRNSHPSLRKLTWGNVKRKPRLQLRALVIKVKGIWNRTPGRIPYNDKVAMVLSAYNQGEGGLRKDRRACRRKKGCDSNLWYGNVRNIKRYGFGTYRIRGTRHTAWQINRRHVGKTLSKSKNYRTKLRTFGRPRQLVKLEKPKHKRLVIATAPKHKQLVTVWSNSELAAISELLG